MSRLSKYEKNIFLFCFRDWFSQHLRLLRLNIFLIIFAAVEYATQPQAFFHSHCWTCFLQVLQVAALLSRSNSPQHSHLSHNYTSIHTNKCFTHLLTGFFFAALLILSIFFFFFITSCFNFLLVKCVCICANVCVSAFLQHRFWSHIPLSFICLFRRVFRSFAAAIKIAGTKASLHTKTGFTSLLRALAALSRPSIIFIITRSIFSLDAVDIAAAMYLVLLFSSLVAVVTLTSPIPCISCVCFAVLSSG